MDKATKLKYQRDVEKYLESKKVYELFEDLLKNLIIHKPLDPLDYLIHKLEDQRTDDYGTNGSYLSKKIFFVGPPGSNVRELALQISDHFKIQCISVGDLLNKEIQKKSEYGQEIEKAQNNGVYVKDNIVIEIVKKHLTQFEQKTYILEGFPKTVVQGLALQKAGILPDTFIFLNLPNNRIYDCALRKISYSEGPWAQLTSKEKEQIAANYATEYLLNLKGVKDIYKGLFFQIDSDLPKEEILEDMAVQISRLIKYRIKNQAPRRSQRIVVLGAPGSGRTSICKLLSKKYGFVHVSTSQLLKDQFSRKTEVGKVVAPKIRNGELVSDDIINGLLNERLEQPDCKIHGYVLDGFPKGLSQIQALEDLKINPSLILLLECSDEVIKSRLENRKVDPITGQVYDLQTNPPEDKDIARRLQTIECDQSDAIEKRWKELLKHIEQQYNHMILKINSTISEKNILEKVSVSLENAE